MSFGFDPSLLGAPLLAGLLVVSTHVLLGRRVLERGIIFIDITIAQLAALGVVIASTVGWTTDEGGGWGSQLAAAAVALAGAALLAWTEKHWPKVQEALIGSVYVVAASAAMLVLSRSPRGAEHMQELLAGQVLWINYEQLWPVLVLYLFVLSAWPWARHRTVAFYFLFALMVMASVQLVGIYLVFATLILPALALHGIAARVGLPLGYAIGSAGYLLGLWLSVPLDLPAGPLIVCVLAALALATAVARHLLQKD